MSISLYSIALVVFFLCWGINYFWPFKNAAVIIAVAALIAGIILLLQVLKFL